jgi:hypothetical protein
MSLQTRLEDSIRLHDSRIKARADLLEMEAKEYEDKARQLRISAAELRKQVNP